MTFDDELPVEQVLEDGTSIRSVTEVMALQCRALGWPESDALKRIADTFSQAEIDQTKRTLRSMGYKKVPD